MGAPIARQEIIRMFLHEGRPWTAALVVADSPHGARRVVTGRRHRPTYLVPIRTSRVHVPCESALERDYVTVASVDPDVVGIAAQPHTLHLRSGPEAFRYTPDFAVERASPPDGGRRVTIVEVKPERFAAEPEQEQRLELLAAAHDHLGFAFEAATEASIRDGCRLQNAELIRRHAVVPVPERVARRVHLLLSTGAAGTIGECLASGAAEGARKEHLLALAWKGHLSLDLGPPLGPGTPIAWTVPAAKEALAALRGAAFAPPRRTNPAGAPVPFPSTKAG